MNDYYDVTLKEARLKMLMKFDNFFFVKGDITVEQEIENIFDEFLPDIVIHLAAQAGVRFSLTNPESYINNNMIGFFRVLENCRHSYDVNGKYTIKGKKGVEHLIYASSSSVYGDNREIPYKEIAQTDCPVSLYAATKKSNELMAYAYSNLYGIPSTGLRFFTVYGPMGRPDMAYFKFANKMIHGDTIQIYNKGNVYRDFTYIDDIVEGIMRVCFRSPHFDTNGVRHKIYNIGNSKPESLLYFIEVLEKSLIREKIISTPAKKEFIAMQPGDVYQTFADVNELYTDFGFRPSIGLEKGLEKFACWYKNYIKSHF